MEVERKEREKASEAERAERKKLEESNGELLTLLAAEKEERLEQFGEVTERAEDLELFISGQVYILINSFIFKCHSLVMFCAGSTIT